MLRDVCTFNGTTHNYMQYVKEGERISLDVCVTKAGNMSEHEPSPTSHPSTSDEEKKAEVIMMNCSGNVHYRFFHNTNSQLPLNLKPKLARLST
jgi:hypothetical protein